MTRSHLLITGAGGNVGRALLRHLDATRFAVTATVRDVPRAQRALNRTDISYLPFDFETQTGFDHLADYDGIFLLRPPHIGDVNCYMRPLIDALAASRVRMTIFLSVQGAERKSYLPHRKIERMIEERGLSHIFVRPSYFMDNLTTTLYPELEAHRRIFLPSGNLRLNWIDVDDVGAAAAALFERYDTYARRGAVTLTNSRHMGFAEIVDTINAHCATALRHESPSVIRFVAYMQKTGHPWSYIGVMLLLHYLPRFEPVPTPTADIADILHREPTAIADFVERNRAKFARLKSTHEGSR